MYRGVQGPRLSTGTIAAMRDADTPPLDPANHTQRRTMHTPRQQAALIRAATAEVYERVREWRSSPGWQNTPVNARRHRLTVDAAAALDVLPEPTRIEDLNGYVDAIRPLLAEWRPSRPGPEQQIYAAVERLRQVCN